MAKLASPELFRLLADGRLGDVLLIEQVNRLSRLTSGDWQRLRAELDAKLDLPTSWMLAALPADEFTTRLLDAMNGMMLDVLAAVARKDYEDRRHQAEGQAKAKAAGIYTGRPEDTQRNEAIAEMLAKKMSWSQIQSATDCSGATIAEIAKRCSCRHRDFRRG